MGHIQESVNRLFAEGRPPAGAGNTCLMPGASAGDGLKDGAQEGAVNVSFAGPWCYCTGAVPNATLVLIPQALLLKLPFRSIPFDASSTHKHCARLRHKITG